MSAIIFIKIMVSVFLLNILVWIGARYFFLVFQRITENELRHYFGKMWIYGFAISIVIFCMILIWFPTLFHEDFFSNPLPTLVFVLIASLVFATVGAISARQPSSSAVALKKLQNELHKKGEKKDM